MSVKVANSRFIVSSLKRCSEFYQQLLCGVSNTQELGSKLVCAIEAANSFRQLDKVEELGLWLVNLPIREHQLIGKYYRGVCAYRKGENERAIFEEVIEKSQTYKSNGLLSLAAVEAGKGDLAYGIKLYTEAMRYADNPSIFLRGARSIAIIKSMEGFHNQALKDLETIAPLIRYATSVDRYQYLNSYAIELSEVGRIEEAQNVSRITLASPYAFAYPEWRETEQDLALRGYRSCSSVRVKTIPGNLLYLPEREVSDTPVIQSGHSESAPVVSLEDWKEKKMVKEPNGEQGDLIPEDLDKLNEKDIIIKIFQLSSQEDLTYDQLRDILEYVIKVTSGK